MISIKTIKRLFLDKVPLDVKNILDIGCGKGYMSRRFARSESLVTGIDIKSQEIVQENFNFEKIDVREFVFGKYDLIISSLMLHFFSENTSKEIIEKMKISTNKEGYNLLVLMSEKDNMNNFGKFYPSIEEVKKVYSGWDLIDYLQDDTEQEINSLGQKHFHNVIFCLFKKPNEN